MSDTTTDTSTLTTVTNTIIDLASGSATDALSTAVQKKIAAWTEEIATTKSSWVQFRDTVYILAVSLEAAKASTQIVAQLAKLKK